MPLFSSHTQSIRHGLIIDIGSGSVLAAIVESDSAEAFPTIIWSKREYVPLHSASGNVAKAVMTALMAVLIEFDTNARKLLQAYDAKANINHIQVTVSAPWSYTVTKNISYHKEEIFTLTLDLVESLVATATKKIEEELAENEQATALDLRITERTPLQLTANGYPITAIKKQQANEITLVYASSIIQDHLADTLEETRKSIAPRANLSITSFMVAYYHLLQKLHPHWLEIAAIDVTFEATEIGIIRGGALRYCTHTPWGSRTIIQKISDATQLPASDIYSRMQGVDHETFLSLLATKHKSVASDIFTEYKTALTQTFTETGDMLALPKILTVHIEHALEPLFIPMIQSAAIACTKIAHTCHPITNTILTNLQKQQTKPIEPILSDTAMLASAQFFHNGYSPSGRSSLLRDILE